MVQMWRKWIDPPSEIHVVRQPEYSIAKLQHFPLTYGTIICSKDLRDELNITCTNSHTSKNAFQLFASDTASSVLRKPVVLFCLSLSSLGVEWVVEGKKKVLAHQVLRSLQC